MFIIIFSYFYFDNKPLNLKYKKKHFMDVMFFKIILIFLWVPTIVLFVSSNKL